MNVRKAKKYLERVLSGDGTHGPEHFKDRTPEEIRSIYGDVLSVVYAAWKELKR